MLPEPTVIINHNICKSNYHALYLKFIVIHVNYFLIKLWGKKTFKKNKYRKNENKHKTYPELSQMLKIVDKDINIVLSLYFTCSQRYRKELNI